MTYFKTVRIDDSSFNKSKGRLRRGTARRGKRPRDHVLPELVDDANPIPFWDAKCKLRDRTLRHSCTYFI